MGTGLSGLFVGLVNIFPLASARHSSWMEVTAVAVIAQTIHLYMLPAGCIE